MEDLRKAGIISAETALRVRAASERTKIITRLVCQRLRADLSQKDVAQRMGRTQSWVSKFEDRLDAELTLGDIEAYCLAIAGRLALEFGRHGQVAA
jgi:DNA-directed RNA polymerase specialized sigma subunit